MIYFQMAFLVRYDDMKDDALKVPIKLLDYANTSTKNIMLCRNKRHYYRFKLHNVDNEVGLITGEDWIKYIEDCGVKQGWTIQFIVSKDYVLISQFDPDGNCNDGRRIYEYGITLMSGLSVSTKHSSSGQVGSVNIAIPLYPAPASIEYFDVIVFPSSLFSGYKFKKDILYSTLTCYGNMVVYVKTNDKKPSGFYGPAWEEFCNKQLIDGSQTFVAYYFASCCFVVTVYDSNGFCANPFCNIDDVEIPDLHVSSEEANKLRQKFSYKLVKSMNLKDVKTENDDLLENDVNIPSKGVDENVTIYNSKKRSVHARCSTSKYAKKIKLHKNTCTNDARVGDLKKSVSYSSGSSKLFKDEKVQKTNKKTQARIEGNSFFIPLKNAAIQGRLTIPAAFVRKFELYNQAKFDDSYSVYVLCMEPRHYEKMVLKKHRDARRNKSFDDHVVMYGNWQRFMDVTAFDQYKELKFFFVNGLETFIVSLE
ncbi:hypothetical protein Tco_0150196 [Tanacetum coccineum]